MKGIYGTPGGSLGGDSKFGAAGVAGEYGERRTAEALEQFGDRCVVVHDIIVPGLSANLDHVVIADKRLLILDSKAWRNGFYHRMLGGSLRRGFEEVEHDRTDGLARMTEMMSETTGAEAQARLVVWPSAKAKQVYIHSSLRRHTVPVHPAYQLERIVKTFIGGASQADDRLATDVLEMMADA